MAVLTTIESLLDQVETEITALKATRMSGGKWRHVLKRLATIDRSITGFFHIPRSP